MNEMVITTECCGREYEHGSITVTKKDMGEWNIKIDTTLTVSSHQYEELHKEIQNVIRKYAL